MFYSHQLLARKAPFGLIWRAATKREKISQKDIKTLDIVDLCDKIMYPQVPMALRLSGILLEGVATAYLEKLNYYTGEALHIMDECRRVKFKPYRDPTRLPKGKSQANYKNITLSDDQLELLGEFEQSHPSINVYKKDMNLDDIDDIDLSAHVEDQHQADRNKIKLCEEFNAFHATNEGLNKDDRFNHEGDQTIWMDLPSSHLDVEPQNLTIAIEEAERETEDQMTKHSPSPPIKRASRILFDYETQIDSKTLRSWLADSSDIIRTRRLVARRTKIHVSERCDIPPVAILGGLITTTEGIYFPPPLLEQWIEHNPPLHDSPTVTDTPHLVASSSASPPQFETARTTVHRDNEMPTMLTYSSNEPAAEAEPIAPSVTREEVRYKLRSGSDVSRRIGKRNSLEPVLEEPPREAHADVPRRTSKRKTFISLDEPVLEDPPLDQPEQHESHNDVPRRMSKRRQSGINVESVGEEPPWEPPKKLKSAKESPPLKDLLAESGSRQTQEEPVKQMHKYLKKYLEENETLSLNKLAHGLNKTEAANLFLRICVLAHNGHLKVQQQIPYGDIKLHKGNKM